MLSAAYKKHYTATLRLAYPVCLSQLGHILTGLADNLMVSGLGTTPLAAASLANGVFAVVLVFGIGLSYGITPLLSFAQGENDQHTISKLFSHGLVINLCSAIILVGICWMLSSLLYFFNQPLPVIELAIPYLRIMLLSLIPLLIFQNCRQWLEGLSFTKAVMVVVIASNVLNVFLNYVLIYGKFGFPHLGMNGSAWATFWARSIMAGSMLLVIIGNRSFRLYLRHLALLSYSKDIFKKILRIGLPAGLQFIFEVGAFAFSAIMMGWISSEALAAHQIAISLASITYMVASGFSSAAMIRVGYFLGKKDQLSLRTAGYSVFVLVFLFMFFCGLIFVIGNHILPTFYSSDHAVISMASSLLLVAALFQLSDGIQVVGLGALRGLKDSKVPTLITFVAYWVVALPLGYLIGIYYKGGPIGIWIGLFVGLTIAAVALFSRFSSKSKKIV